MKKMAALAVLSSLLVGCGSIYNPLPDGYAGPKAKVVDTYKNHTGSTAHFFELIKVDGKVVDNSGWRTYRVNRGRGFQMTPSMVSREIPTKTQTFTIEGFVYFATDAQAIFGNDMHVVGDMTFTPVANETYFVKGDLDKKGSVVWLEDSKGNVVGEKIREKASE